MSVVSADGQRSFSDLCHIIFILLHILISLVRSSEADIVSTSLNFTSGKFIPVFVNNTQTNKGSAVKSSNIIVLNKVNETISSLEHKTHRRTYFNQTEGINLIGSSTNSNLSNQLVFNNLSYNGIISSPLTSNDPLRIARTINTATTTAALTIQRDDNSQQICNEKTHEGCKVQNFERCTKTKNCECIRGYMVSKKTGSCAAVQYFWANLYIKRQPLLNVELDELSGGYKKLEKQLKFELLSIFRSQKLTGLLDVQMVHIIWKATYVEVNFRVSVEKSLAPSVEDVEKLYKEGLADTVNSGIYKYIRWDQLEGSNSKNKLTEFNHCLDPSYNYCSLDAICTHYMKSFLCKCKAGYDDISPDIIRAPGEICTIGCGCQNNGTCDRSNNRKVCRCPVPFSGDRCQIRLHDRCPCQNNGTCRLKNGKVTCDCPTWFPGEKCEVNGKLLVIILCSTVGGLLFLTLLICIVCIFVYRRKAKKRNNKAANARHLSTSESTLVKLPRFWTEAGSPQVYEVPVSPDRRRWSFVSDPVRYPEDLILEDHYRPGTLPLPKFYDTNRRHLMAYQNPSFQSSTLPLRPAYQQDKWRSYYPAPRSVAY